MYNSIGFTLFGALLVCASANPIYEINASDPASIVKRHTQAPLNSDVHLKQISLQALIGDLEHSLFASADSVSSLAHDSDAILKEVTLATEPTTHATRKRHTEETSTAASTSTSTATSTATSTSTTLPSVVDVTPLETTEATPLKPKAIILQTTERVPARDGIPAHLLIDRVSVLKQQGGVVPLLPHFEVKHTKLITATIKENTEGNPTEISITKTATTLASRVPGVTLEQSNTAEIISSTSTTEATVNHADVTSTKTVIPTSTAENTHVTEKTDSTHQLESSTTTTTPTETTESVSITTENTDLVDSTYSTSEASADKSSSTESLSSTTIDLVDSTSEASADKSSSTASLSTTTAATTSSTTTSTTSAPTTKTPIVKLKEAEQNLHEKVAEIEALPIILSSRV